MLPDFAFLSLFSSIVGFGAKQRTMGLSAKNQMIMNFKNTIWGFKILVGRKFSDPFVQEEIKQFPYEVVKLPNDGIGIKVGMLHAWHVKWLHGLRGRFRGSPKITSPVTSSLPCSSHPLFCPSSPSSSGALR